MNVGFIGMGNMGQMLVSALVRSGALKPGEVVISNRNPAKLDLVAARHPGIAKAHTNADLARRCGVIFLCIKPGETRAVLDEIGPYITANHLVITITNALDIAQLEQCVPARIAKVIPSLVQTVSAGGSLVAFGQRCTPDDHALVMRLMAAISQPFVIAEAQARVASNLTSCGPAFLSYTFRALAEASRRYQPDLAPDQIDQMIRVTVKATCELMDQGGYSFDDIIQKISVPGGVTADGIAVMDELFAGLWEQVVETTIRKENAKKAKMHL